jgi:hypothetical protein
MYPINAVLITMRASPGTAANSDRKDQPLARFSKTSDARRSFNFCAQSLSVCVRRGRLGIAQFDWQLINFLCPFELFNSVRFQLNEHTEVYTHTVSN